MQALEPYEVWFTGLRREQSPTRKNLKKVEQHRLPSGKNLLKASLLADWTWPQVWDYTISNGLSYLPQYDEGYLSIGCEPCTKIPDPGAILDQAYKTECGIHTGGSSRDRVHDCHGGKGMTGIGGGSLRFRRAARRFDWAKPWALLFFAAVLHLGAAPFYLAGKQVHSASLGFAAGRGARSCDRHCDTPLAEPERGQSL
jgi:3'-phosphoadenosine 5'-phosphosulfate sulfotransferase (PAPS reductase)/FAD synthetase